MYNLLKKFQHTAQDVRKVGVGLLLAGLTVTSCSEMDKYFETPSWLRGSIQETLTEDGNYSQFLAAAERVGFKPILEGASICTVMAPEDSEMNAYLQKNFGTTDVNAIDYQELKKLIGLHILYYSFDTDMLTNFRPTEGDGADMTLPEVQKTMGSYFKFRTRSQDPITVERDTMSLAQPDGTYRDSIGEPKSVYHLERYVPVFNHYLYQTKEIDNPAYNYNYFYPETSAEGILSGKFNVANAAVTEYAVKTSNGYIYRIDKVLKPLETIYSELKKRPEYSRYLKLYNQYRQYQKSEDLTNQYGNGSDLYQILHGSLAPIALEWPVTDYTDVVNLSSKSYSVFPFTNSSIEEFFNDYWKEGGYTSLDDKDLRDNIGILLGNSYYSASIVFPEEITKGRIINTNLNDEIISFPVDQIAQENRVICANGVLYGCTTLTPPAIFGSVTGPAYQYKKYSVMLKMMRTADKSDKVAIPTKNGLIQTLGLNSSKYIMLVPSDYEINKPYGQAYKGVVLEKQDDGTGNITTFIKDLGTNLRAQWSSERAMFMHVSKNLEGTSISTDLAANAMGKGVIRTYSTQQSDKKYWYLKNGKITNSVKFADMLYYAANPVYANGRSNPDADYIWSNIKKVNYRGNQEWSNGTCWEYDKSLFIGDYDYNIGQYSSIYSIMQNNPSDSTTDFYGWYKLLTALGLLTSTTDNLKLDQADNYITFIPTTQTLAQAIIDGKIPYVSVPAGTAVNDVFDNLSVPATGTEDFRMLKKYLRSYYVPMSSANVGEYPYIGWGEQTKNALVTADSDESDEQGNELTTNINIYDNGSKLYVKRCVQKKNAQGKYYYEELPTAVDVTSEYDFFPIIFQKECVHFLNGVLPLSSEGK